MSQSAVQSHQPLLSYIDQSITYHEYVEATDLFGERIKDGDSEGITYPQYIPINRQRLRRGNKLARPSDEAIAKLSLLDQHVYWLVLTEHWCGDAAQSLPLMHKFAAYSGGKLSLHIVLRDENTALMDRFLTRNARSIPKLIQLNEAGRVTGTWGPRPAEAQTLVDQLKATNQPYSEALHAWYARDKYQQLNAEFSQLIDQV